MPYIRYLVVLMLCQPVTNLLAQNTLIKAGINISSLAGLEEQGDLIAYHIAVGGLKNISDNVSLKHELIFSVQGSKLSADGDKLVYHYLNMPLLLNARCGKNVSLDAGPQLGVVLRAMEKGNSDRDITANLNTVDLSFCIGVNYMLTQNFFTEGRFNLGITNLSRVSESNGYRNAVFQGSVGYYFNRKKQQPE